jgi:hypothetical protein
MDDKPAVMPVYRDGELIEYTSFSKSGWSIGRVVRYADGHEQPPLVYIRARSGGKPFQVRENQIRKAGPTA